MPKTLEKPEVTEGFYFRESDHHYFLDGKPMTGCTTILGVIAKPALVQWAANEACRHVRENLKEGLVTDAFIDDLLQEARTAHAKKRDKGAEQGTDIHALVEIFVNYAIANHDGQPLGAYPDAIKGFVEWAQKENIRFIASEKKLYSKELWVAGTADLMFEKGGKTFVGDIKTYKKLWDRTPMLQCAGYGIMHREMTGTAIDGYCIINLPKERAFNEEEDIRWSYDIAGDEAGFLAAVTLYRTLDNWN